MEKNNQTKEPIKRESIKQNNQYGEKQSYRRIIQEMINQTEESFNRLSFKQKNQ
jgi:hypothetical protein